MKPSSITEKPWGRFEQFTNNELSTVKIMEVEAGKRLSLQSHQHREEWWIALDDGVIAEVDGVQKILKKGEQVFVPKGSRHRLSCAASPIEGAPKKVRVLEIAFGEFDEEDIVRYEDDWGRE